MKADGFVAMVARLGTSREQATGGDAAFQDHADPQETLDNLIGLARQIDQELRQRQRAATKGPTMG